MAELKCACGILGIEKAGKKEELIDAVLKFCIKPDDTGRKPPGKRKCHLAC